MVQPTALSSSSPTAPAPSGNGPPQRQSCDRCHKQKLRCIRSKSTNGGVCDRCLSKRAQCVYSVSLPKGRPSLHRLAEESALTRNRASASLSGPTNKPVTTSPSETSANMIIDTRHAASTDPGDLSILAGLFDTPMDMSSGPWPWLEASSWDDMQLDLDWSSQGSTNVDSMLASLDGPRESPEPPSPAPPRSVYPSAPPPYNYGSTTGTKNNAEKFIVAPSPPQPPPPPPEKYNNHASLIIAHLSQLSMRLSSLRYWSSTAAQVPSSKPRSKDNKNRPQPFLHSAAFKSVTAWLADDQCSAIMSAHHVPLDMSNPYPCPETHQGDHSAILRDIFCASHRLLEILRLLQTNSSIVQPLASMSRSTTSPNINNNSSNHMTPIIRHLVMACNALLLETYGAILTVLHYDVQQYHPNTNAPTSNTLSLTTALGNVRLVLVVQLCSYLIERQHRAVDQCFGTAAPEGRPLPTPPGLASFQGLDAGDGEALRQLKDLVQKQLDKLEEVLRNS